MLDKILDYTGKIFTILLLTAIGILFMTGAIALLFKTLNWISEVM